LAAGGIQQLWGIPMKMCDASFWLLTGALATSATCMGAQAAEEARVGMANVTTAEAQVAGAPAELPGGRMKADDYRIGAHDLLDISVFQVPDLSRTVRVNSRGLISIPLIGAVQAAGLTSDELETSIAKKLSQSYLQDPQVSVFIKEYISQRVTVEGSVEKAGVYQLTGSTTLLQAIAMASGTDQLADESAIKIFRTDSNGKRQTLVYNLEEIREGKKPDPEIKGDDVVVVEKSTSRSLVKSVTDSVRGILSFGRY
jgi:polysaccharide export outer membrane protein